MSTYVIMNIIQHKYGTNPDFSTEVVELQNVTKYIETITRQCAELGFELKLTEQGVLIFEKGEKEEQHRVIVQVLSLNDYLVDGERKLVNPRETTSATEKAPSEENTEQSEVPSESLNDIIEDDNS